MHTCIHTFTHIECRFTYTHTYTHVSTYSIYTHMYTLIHTHTYLYSVYTDACTYIHMCTHAFTHTLTHMYLHIYIQDAHIHVLSHTHSHMYTHRDVQVGAAQGQRGAWPEGEGRGLKGSGGVTWKGEGLLPAAWYPEALATGAVLERGVASRQVSREEGLAGAGRRRSGWSCRRPRKPRTCPGEEGGPLLGDGRGGEECP